MKKQILNVGFKEDEGVLLNWSFNDLFKKNKYFRHIIVLLTSKQQEAQNFLQDYIKRIKPGDLFTVLYKSTNSQIKINQWRQKTYNWDFSIQHYINIKSIEILNISQGLEIIQKSLQQISEAPILNYLIERPDQIDALQKKISLYDPYGKMRFMNTVFSPCRGNSLSVSQGINVISLKEEQALQFYHQHISQVVVEYAVLSITCRNGQLTSSQPRDWKNNSFNKVQRFYHAPTTKYSLDILHIINHKISLKGSYQLDINLSYKNLSGVVYHAQKQITINFNHSGFYNRTVVAPKRKKTYIAGKDMHLQANPYLSQTFICFQKEIRGQQAEDL